MASDIILAPKEFVISDEVNQTYFFTMVELEQTLRDPDDKLSAFSLISLQMLIVLIINQIIFICLTIRACSTLESRESIIEIRRPRSLTERVEENK